MPALVAMGVVGLAVAGIVAAYTSSTVAKNLGLSNDPTNPQAVARLVWLSTWAPYALATIRREFPGAYRTSGYRSDAVNAAVNGSPSSYHRYGLAFDVGGVGDFSQVVRAAQLVRDNARHMGPLRTVLAEQTRGLHVHLDFFDPLGEIPRDRQAAFCQENPDGSWSALP